MDLAEAFVITVVILASDLLMRTIQELNYRWQIARHLAHNMSMATVVNLWPWNLGGGTQGHSNW